LHAASATWKHAKEEEELFMTTIAASKLGTSTASSADRLFNFSAGPGVRMDDLTKKQDFTAMQALQQRQAVAMMVDLTQTMAADALKMSFDDEFADWTKRAANPAASERAKYQKMVSMAEPLAGLAPDDEKFRRGYAVLRSIDNDGPDTEAAVFALHQRMAQETEQLAYDQHNLKGQLRRHLTTFVGIASKVDFNAETVEKNKKTLFVNAADERQGALWKACFRAGEAPTAAALKLARAWLAELQP
jgi:hypothetical protein